MWQSRLLITHTLTVKCVINGFAIYTNTNQSSKIGGPSSRWVWQGMRASQHCIEQATNIQAPLLIIQAGNDRIVDNDKQQQFLAAMQSGKGQLITIDGANHELLF